MGIIGAPKRIRIAVYSLKGCHPRPLDDGGTLLEYNRDKASRQRHKEIIHQLIPSFLNWDKTHFNPLPLNPS